MYIKKTKWHCSSQGAPGRRRRVWDVAPLALMWTIRRKRNWRAFDGVEKHFGNWRNSFFSLTYFWCTYEVPICIDDWVSYLENHIFVYGFLRSFWYTYCIRACFGIKKKKKRSSWVRWWSASFLRASSMFWISVKKFKFGPLSA